MKKLQNNFTTPEQSKRLLGLGVPADSADCYFYDWDLKDTDIHTIGNMPQIFDSFERGIEKFEKRKCIKMYPCWSAGRLIEIYNMCTSENEIYIPKNHIVLDKVLIEFFGALTSNRMDFSKLEE